jgi:hypothetical protein
MDQIRPWDRKNRARFAPHMREFHDGVEKDIKAYGRRVVCVGATENATDPNDFFAYTIGNARKGLPELLAIGISQNAYILNLLSDMMIRRGHKFADGELVALGEKSVPVCLVDATDTVKDLLTVQAGEHYSSQDYGVMQVVAPDSAGLFPWQPKCATPYSRVAVYRRANGVLRLSTGRTKPRDSPHCIRGSCVLAAPYFPPTTSSGLPP